MLKHFLVELFLSSGTLTKVLKIIREFSINSVISSNHSHLTMSELSRAFKVWKKLFLKPSYKAIISFWNWEKTQNNTGLANTESFCSPEFREFSFNAVSRWYELIEDWVTWATNLKIIFFEKLTSNPVEETRQILRHLNIPVEGGRMKCLSKHLEGSYHRGKSTVGNPFTPEHKRVISWAIQKAGQLLWETLKLEMPDYQIDQQGRESLVCPPVAAVSGSG